MKWIYGFLVTAFLIALSGCGGGGSSPNNNNSGAGSGEPKATAAQFAGTYTGIYYAYPCTLTITNDGTNVMSIAGSVGPYVPEEGIVCEAYTLQNGEQFAISTATDPEMSVSAWIAPIIVSGLCTTPSALTSAAGTLHTTLNSSNNVQTITGNLSFTLNDETTTFPVNLTRAS